MSAARQPRSTTPVPCGCPGTPHKHGERATYVTHRCGCPPCKAANAAYQTGRAMKAAQGKPTSGYVDAGPAREHLAALSAAGLGLRAVAARSGVSRSILGGVRYGRRRADRGGAQESPARRILARNAAAILAIPIPTVDDLLDGRAVDGTGTRRRLQALVAIGHTQSALADQLGMLVTNLTATVHGHHPYVTVARRRQVIALYEDLWDQPPPDGRSKTVAMNLAARYGWQPPMAWDDDTIDVPEAGVGATVSLDDDLIDDVAVDAACRGRHVPLTTAELDAVVSRLRQRKHDDGRADGLRWGAGTIAKHIGRTRKEIEAAMYRLEGRRDRQQAA